MLGLRRTFSASALWRRCSAQPTRYCGADRNFPLRIPVFSRLANPSVDPPIIRKSVAYCARQVADLLAVWIDPANPSKGIRCREFLPREVLPVFTSEPANPALPPVEVQGCYFVDPEPSEEKLAERNRLIQEARMITHFGPGKELVQVAP